MAIRIITLIAYIIILGDCAVPVPDVLPICHRKDPDVGKCIINSLEAIRPILIKGVPARGIPQLDPIVIDEVTIAEKAKVGFGLTVKNVVATGASQFKLSNFKFNSKENIHEFVVSIPSLDLTGEYNVDGEVLRIPVKGQGPFTGKLTELSGMVKMKAEIIRKDDINQMVIKKLRIRVHVGNGKIKAENLFNGDENIGNAVNEVINENFNALADDMLPFVEKLLEERILVIGNTLSSYYDYDKFFPE